MSIMVFKLLLWQLLCRDIHICPHICLQIFYFLLSNLSLGVYIYLSVEVSCIYCTLSFATTIQTQCFTSQNLFDHVRWQRINEQSPILWMHGDIFGFWSVHLYKIYLHSIFCSPMVLIQHNARVKVIGIWTFNHI
jgi:hypothetical protein